MAFLTDLLTAILEKTLGALIDWIRAKKAQRDADQSAQDDAQRSVQKLKDAKTGSEIDQASDDALNGV